jgi:hypothetical protein
MPRLPGTVNKRAGRAGEDLAGAGRAQQPGAGNLVRGGKTHFPREL